MKAFRKLLLAALCGLSVGAQASTSGVVISQVYGGGGNSGATYTHDFVEIFNAGSTAVSLSGWSVQYASASGSSWAVTNLSGSLQPGQYHLVRMAQGAGGTVALPTPDTLGSTAMASASGKVALVSSTTALSGSVPSSGSLVDLVGYGTVSAAEGSAAPTLSNSTANARAANGCTDTDNNANDFAAGAPTPRNTASAFNSCGLSGNAPIVTSCPAISVPLGTSFEALFSATDADTSMSGVVITSASAAGFAVTNVVLNSTSSSSSTSGGALSGKLSVPNLPVGTHTVDLLFSNTAAQSALCTLSLTFLPQLTAYTAIYDIQGNGDSSPLAGTSVTTQGVVTAVFASLNGYYIQDETGDGDVATSDGIFVYSPGGISVSVGQRIRVTGTVTEYNTVTELTNPSGLTVLASGISIAPTPVVLPEAFNGELERYEGMLVRIDAPMTVAQNYFQGRYGQVTLAAGGRLIKPTNVHRPGSVEALALAAENARRVLMLDDGSSSQNPNPIPYIGLDNTLRAGDSVSNLIGVIDHGLINSDTSATAPRDYKLHPTVAPVFSRDNPRTAAPAAVGGNVKVASFNVLNYFSTLDVAGNGCYPGGTRSDCRGADSAAEFTRQQAKIVAAMTAINADVFGLMEIENNGNVAAQNLVSALNAVAGAGTWAVVPAPASGTGTDAIRVAMIYKPARLSLVGASLSDVDAINNRPPFAQTFAAANGEKFSVIVNHMKSKSCGSDGGVDADNGDGQGCYNGRRQLQAQRLLNHFIPLVKAAAGDDDVLVIGDLNAYGMEDPVVTLTDAGLVNEAARFIATPYSYIFDGESGNLDHALSTPSLSAQVSGVAEWHINADEPSVIDYNTEFKPQDLYAANAYRSSDHDPVVIGLQLVRKLAGTAARDTLTGTAGDDEIEGGEGADAITTGGGRDVIVYRSLRDAGDTVSDFAPGSDRIDLHALLAAIGYSGSDAVASGHVRIVTATGGLAVQIDSDGFAGSAAARTLVLLKGVTLASFDAQRDVIY